MGAEHLSLENRVEQLAGQMEELTRRVNQLSLRLDSAATTKPTAVKEVYAAGDAMPQKNCSLGWASLRSCSVFPPSVFFWS